jgi:hypothetical protein
MKKFMAELARAFELIINVPLLAIATVMLVFGAAAFIFI